MDDRDGGEDGEDPKGGGHGSPALKEGAEDDEDDALGTFHESYFAGADEGFGACARVADHERGGHDEGDEEDVEVAVAASVEDEQTEEEGDVGVAVEDGVKEGAEDGDLVGLAGDAAVDHVKEAGADDDEAGVEEHANVVVGARVAEEEGGDNVDEQADEGEGVGRDPRERETVDDLLQQPAAALTECACPGHAVFQVYRGLRVSGSVALFCGGEFGGLRAGEGETMAEDEGVGGVCGADFFEDGEEIAADGEGGAGLGGLVVVGACATEDELAAALTERGVAGDFEGFCGLAVVGFGIAGGGGIEGDEVSFGDDFGGAVVVDVVPLERGAGGGDGEPGGELHALGGSRWLRVIAVFEDACPVAGEGLSEIGARLVGGDGGRRLGCEGEGQQEACGENEVAHEDSYGADLGKFRAVKDCFEEGYSEGTFAVS